MDIRGHARHVWFHVIFLCIALFVAEDIARMISCQMAKWRLQGQPRDIQLALGSGSNGRHQGHLWCQAASKIYGRAVLQLHGFTIGRNIRCIHKIFYSIQQLYKEELCARFWVKGFKVKVHQDKSSLYLKRARSLVLTNSWPQEAGDILGLGGIIGIWAAQALLLGADFPLLHPCLKTGQLAVFSRKSEVWISMYNILILMLATIFFPKKKQWEQNFHSDVLESAFSLCRFLFPA